MGVFGINSPFAVGLNKLVRMLYAGMLCFLCSIPVITIGAAQTALYEVLLKLEKNQEGYIGRSFFRAFRKNLKSSTLVFLPLFVAELVFGFNLFFYAVLGGGQFPVQCVVFTVLFLLTLILSCYAFPVMARFENTAAGTIRMAALLALRNPVWTVVILLVQTGAVVVSYFFLYFPLLFIMGLTGYVQAAIFNHIFDRLLAEGKITERDNKECEEGV